MKIEIAVQCHHFQKRMCWMMSSILQQEYAGPRPEIVFDIAHFRTYRGLDIHRIASTFRGAGLDVRQSMFDDYEFFQRRGLTRNIQLERCPADWIIFADCDMVYPPVFFDVLAACLENNREETRLLHGPRISTKLLPTEQLVNQQTYPIVIPDAWKQADRLEKRRTPIWNMGAGFCQIVNVPLFRERFDGYYQDPGGKFWDWPWSKGQKAKSDNHFRKKVGAKPIPLPMQVHLQHVRDAGCGAHIEDER